MEILVNLSFQKFKKLSIHSLYNNAKVKQFFLYCFRLIMKKSSAEKSVVVNDDQKFLEGINLVTGDKIDYAKHILSENEVTALCIDEKFSKLQKFIYIITHGEKIQKWSIFENIVLYIENSQSAEKIFLLLDKNYAEYEEFLGILGESVVNYLEFSLKNGEFINKKCYDAIYRLIFRTITSVKYQGNEVLSDWMKALEIFFQFPENHQTVSNRSGKLNEFKQFINGSFSMSTLPQRRKTALEMINAILDLSQEVEKQAHSKIIFFNNDLNAATRLVICRIIEKILSKNSNNPDLWKCVNDYYYTDKSRLVKQKSFEIISSIYFKSNAQMVFSQLQNQQKVQKQIVVKYSPKIFTTFTVQIRSEPKFQLKSISFLNRLLRKNMDLNFSIVVESYNILLNSISQKILVEELQFKKFDLESPNIICDLIMFHGQIGHFELKQDIKRQIIKGLRYHEFDIKMDKDTVFNLLDILEYMCQQDISVFLLLFSKQIDNSKWKNISIFLDKIPKIKFYQSQYEKVSSFLMKIYSNCPYFLIQKVNSVILYLLLHDRKNLDIYMKIKEKFMIARCWMLRRNYIKLYAYIKKNASFQFNKFISTLVYKNILNEKNSLIKLEFIKEMQQIYSYIDPTQQQEKMALKQTVSKMLDSKDKQLANMAQTFLETIKQIDRDYELVHIRIMRNKEMVIREQQIQQVQSEIKKHIKTEKYINKDSKDLKEIKLIKPKKNSIAETKTTTNLIKIGALQKNKITLGQNKPNMMRSNSTQAKKDIKLLFPPTNKKTKL